MPNKKKQRRYAWHFTGETLRDGKPLPKVGKWEVFNGKVVMCESGLHVGITPFDALQYAPGNNLRLVEYADVCGTQTDKIVCRKRRTVAQFDASEILRYFARLQAIALLEHWTTEPPEVVLDYLATGDESIRAAAESAAYSAARSAYSADSAARSAYSAADSAARSAYSAARSAYSAAYSAAYELFNQLIHECFEGPMKELGIPNAQED